MRLCFPADMGSSSSRCLQSGNHGDDPCLTKRSVDKREGGEAGERPTPMTIGLQSIDKSQGDALNGVQSLGPETNEIGKWERRTKSVQAFS